MLLIARCVPLYLKISHECFTDIAWRAARLLRGKTIVRVTQQNFLLFEARLHVNVRSDTGTPINSSMKLCRGKNHQQSDHFNCPESLHYVRYSRKRYTRYLRTAVTENTFYRTARETTHSAEYGRNFPSRFSGKQKQRGTHNENVGFGKYLVEVFPYERQCLAFCTPPPPCREYELGSSSERGHAILLHVGTPLSDT